MVLFHAREAFVGAPAIVRDVVDRGNIGVNLFFVLSGFVLAYNYAVPGRTFTLRDFWTARFARIYPVYLFAFLLFAPRMAMGPAGEDVLATALTTLTLTQAWTGHMTWNTPGWSLSAEAFFYLSFPAILLAMRRLRLFQLLMLMPAVWMAGLVAPLLLLAGVIHPVWHDVVYYSPLARLPEFVIGVALGRVFLDGCAAAALRRWSAPLSIGAAAALLAVLAAGRNVPGALLHNGLLDPIFALLVLGLAGGVGPLAAVLSRPTMKLLGDASYSVYILQTPVFMWLKALACLLLFGSIGIGNQTLNHSLLFTLAYGIVLVAVSVLTFYWLEMPARVVLRRSLANVPGWRSIRSSTLRHVGTIDEAEPSPLLVRVRD